MRLWTVHPKYLDAKGIVAAWREALLAQKVLQGKTKGYKHHPQLLRFKEHEDPVAALATFLTGLADEATRRGYQFDKSKISRKKFPGTISETHGQLLYEWKHLKSKLRKRAPELAKQFKDIEKPEPHPLFVIVAGEVREWEIR
jgi:hypothetical protein